MIKHDYNYEIEAEKILWEVHAANKLVEFQKLVTRYESIMTRADALVSAYRWFKLNLIRLIVILYIYYL